MKPEDVSPVASAALTRAFDAGQVEFRLEEEPRIVFPTDDAFQAWFLAEMAAHERQVRERVAALIEDPSMWPDHFGAWTADQAEAARTMKGYILARIARGES